MKFLGTDFSMKYIIVELDGREYILSFRETFIKGVYDVSLIVGGVTYHVKIKDAYPGVFRKAREGALLVRVKLENLINRISNR